VSGNVSGPKLFPQSHDRGRKKKSKINESTGKTKKYNHHEKENTNSNRNDSTLLEGVKKKEKGGVIKLGSKNRKGWGNFKIEESN